MSPMHPPAWKALFDGILAEGTRLVLADGTGDMPAGVVGFGRSLLHATRALFELGHSAVCVLNSDSPTLPTACLAEAARSLAGGCDIVLGPADDGGYYLLGMRAAHAELYSNIAWSTEHVMVQSRAAARSAGLAVHELPIWYDVDDRAALDRLVTDLDSAAGYAALATAARIAALKLRDRLSA